MQVFRLGAASPAANAPLLEQLAAGRHEIAGLMGCISYSHHKLSDGMLAACPEAVGRFMDSLSADLQPLVRVLPAGGTIRPARWVPGTHNQENTNGHTYPKNRARLNTGCFSAGGLPQGCGAVPGQPQRRPAAAGASTLNPPP